MKVLKKLLIVLFPLGMIYCILHTLAKDVYTFIGSFLICVGGIVAGMYLVRLGVVDDVLAHVTNWLRGFIG